MRRIVVEPEQLNETIPSATWDRVCEINGVPSLEVPFVIIIRNVIRPVADKQELSLLCVHVNPVKQGGQTAHGACFHIKMLPSQEQAASHYSKIAFTFRCEKWHRLVLQVDLACTPASTW